MSRPHPHSRGIAAPSCPFHMTMLRKSAISDDVIRERGYETLSRTNTDNRPVDRLRRAGFASAVLEPARFPGLLIPLYGPTGLRTNPLYRPDRPRGDGGKPCKYEAVRGRPPVLDVHPRNVARLADPTVALWVTEGVKKGDALTTAGECAISLSGVFNWRTREGTLGAWEDVQLRGRKVLVCFDSDAATNRNVARAMKRFGAWLKSRGAKVSYIVVPAVGENGKAGADDHLAAGGTVAELLAAATTRPPDPDSGDASLTDSRLAERVTDEALVDRFKWVRGLGWLAYRDGVWVDVGEELVVEAVRQHLKQMLRDAVEAGADAAHLTNLSKLQSHSKIRNITALTKGIEGVVAEATDFDSDPWLLNAGNGVIDLMTGTLLDHDPAFLMRKQTPVHFVHDATSEDWSRALAALLDPETARWVQTYLGSGTTGLTPREDIITFWHGGGSNGKSTLLGAVQTALGTYSKVMAPTMLGGRREEHPTEFMDLMGTRLAFMEETADGHRLDVVKLKKFTGTDTISGRRMRQDFVSFTPSHTTVMTTNYRPVVSDTDHGTWRRLRMVPFPFTFGQDGCLVDRNLRARLIHGERQQQAVLRWLADGARRWYDVTSHCHPSRPPSPGPPRSGGSPPT